MRLINADALKKAIIKLDLDNTSHWSCIQEIDNAPSISIPIKYKGEWIDRMADKGYLECPYCHKQISGGDLNFCVKCGADMRKGDET